MSRKFIESTADIIQQNEQIEWKSASVEKPDADAEITVLVCDEDRQVCEGFWDGELWRLADGGTSPSEILFWADMPSGPGGAK